MRYGRRIRNGNSVDVQWCELTQDEVLETLKDNIKLNGQIYQHCLDEVLKLKNLSKPEGKATIAVNPQLKKEINEVALALFHQCSVKAFIALQEALDEKIHSHKSNTPDPQLKD